MNRGCFLAVVAVIVALILSAMADGIAVALWALTISVIVFCLVVGGSAVVALIRLLVGK